MSIMQQKSITYLLREKKHENCSNSVLNSSKQDIWGWSTLHLCHSIIEVAVILEEQRVKVQ